MSLEKIKIEVEILLLTLLRVLSVIALIGGVFYGLYRLINWLGSLPEATQGKMIDIMFYACLVGLGVSALFILFLGVITAYRKTKERYERNRN